MLVTQAMTIETRRAPSGRRPTQCPCFLFGAKGASAGVEYRGIRQRLPFQCNETKTSRAAGGGHHGSQDGIIASAFGSRRPTLVGITCTSCSPSKWPLLAPFPLNIWEEDQGLYIERYTTVEGIEFSSDPEAIELIQVVHRISSRTPLARLFILHTVCHQPLRQSTTLE